MQEPVVVTHDGVVLSGNGRTMAGEIAARDGSDSEYTDYLRRHAADYGFTEEDVAGMEHPRVLFVPDEPMPYTTATMAKFNKSGMKQQSKTETAVKMGKLVDNALFGRIAATIGGYETLGAFYADDSATAAVVRELAKAGVVGETEIPSLFDGGSLSQSGQELIESLLVGKLFAANPDAVRQLTEVRNLRQSVAYAIQAIVRNSELGGGYSLAEELARAVRLAYLARKNGFKAGDRVSGFARQGNLFQYDDGATVEDFSNATVMMLADALNDGRVSLLKSALVQYNELAADAAAGVAGIFSGETRTKEDIIKFINDYLFGKRGKEEKEESNGREQDESAGDKHAGKPDAESGTGGGSVEESNERDGAGRADEPIAGTEAPIASENKTDGTAEQEDEPKPIGKGAFGNIYDAFKGKAKRAIDFLRKLQSGEARAALHHKDIGEISLVWGNEMAGLKKILRKHPEVVDNLQEIIGGMKVTHSSDNRIVLESDTHKAVVSKMLGQEKTPQWLLTAYEKKPATGGISDIVPEPKGGKQNGTAPLQDNASSTDKSTDNAAPAQGTAGKSGENGVAAKEEPAKETAEGKGYTITPATYTNKKGKTSDVHLLTFDKELTAEQERAVKEFAKERTGKGRFAPARGWKDRESGGWMFRTEEDARKAAELAADPEAVADNQPLSARDMRDAVKTETHEEEKKPEPEPKPAPKDAPKTEHSAEGNTTETKKEEAKAEDTKTENAAPEETEGTKVEETKTETGIETELNADFAAVFPNSGKPSGLTLDFSSKGNKRLSARNFVSSNPMRPQMGGVHYDGGFAVASNGRAMAVVRTDYAPELEGKTLFAKGGTETGGRPFPDWRAAAAKFASQNKTAVDAAAFMEAAKKAKAAQKGLEYGAFASVIVGGRVMEADKAAIIADALAKVSNAELYATELGLMVTGDGAIVVVMHDVLLKEDDVRSLGYPLFPVDGEAAAAERIRAAEGEDGKRKDAEERGASEEGSKTEAGASDTATNAVEDTQKGGENKKGKSAKGKPAQADESATDEETGHHVLYQKAEGASPVSREEQTLRGALADHLRESGMEVIDDAEEGQRVLDVANGRGARLEAKQKRALATVSVSRSEKHPQTVIASATGAKVLNNLDSLAENYEKSADTKEKTFIGEVAKALGIASRSKSSQYATFETKSGKVVTIRLSNHNATVSNFDNNGEADGISIVVSPKKNEGVANDGEAHVTEFFYDAIKLRKAEGKPLAEIVRSIQQALYSGEFEDRTGLAERQEVNASGAEREQRDDGVRFFRTSSGAAYGFTVGGKIYIDPRIATSETPIHEYAHLWASALRAGNAKEWRHVVSLMKGTGLWEEVKRNYPELTTDDEIADEVIAHYSGRRGAERLREEARKIAEGKGGVLEKAEAVSTLERVRRALSAFWKGVADFLHIRYTSAEEVADRVMKDMLDGVDPRKFGKDNGLRLEKSAEVENIVSKAKANGTYMKAPNGERSKLSPRQWAQDEAYLDAVTRGDMEAAQRMVDEAAERAGYSSKSEYQGTSAFNGAAPYGNGYFLSKEERKEAWDNGEYDGDQTLGDYIERGIDAMNLDFVALDPRNYRMADANRKEAIENVRDTISRKSKTITMYRSVPSGVKENSFRNGDWVSPSRGYAEENARIHGWGSNYRIIEQEVPVDEVWWDGNDIAEWGYGREADYVNGTDYAYKNTRNNRKSLETVTYDNRWNIIPLSQRFNSRKADVRYRENNAQNTESQVRTEENEATEQAKTERVNELSGRLDTPVRVISTEEEIAGLPNDRQRRAKGWYDTRTGEVTIVMPNNADAADVENTFLHEVVGHDGLRVLFPEEGQLDNALDELYRVSERGIQQTIDRMAQKMQEAEVARLMEQKRKQHEARGENPNTYYYADLAEASLEASKKRGQYRRAAAEEYAADLAGRIGVEGFEKMGAEERTFWGRLKAVLQNALRRLSAGLGIKSKREWTDKEWAYVLHEAYKRKKNGGRPSAFDVADTVVMRGKTKFGEANREEEAKQTIVEKMKRKVADMFEKARSGEFKGKPESIGKLTSAGRAYLEKISGIRLKENVDFVLNPSDLQHINKEHFGENEKDRGNNEPLTMDDIRNIVDVISNPDAIVYGTDKEGKKLFFFLQAHGDGTYNLAEVYGDKRGNLTAKSFYNTKKKGISQRVNEIKTSLHTTSETSGEFLSSAAKIPTMFDIGESSSESVSDTDIMFRDGDGVEYQKAQARDTYERRVATGLYQAREALQDSMLSLKVAMDTIMKAEGKKTRIEDIAGYENAYLGENRLSSVNQAECKEYARTLFKPLLEEVAKLAATADERDELTDYMMAKHGLERNEVMARRNAERQANEEYGALIRKAERDLDKYPGDDMYMARLDEVRQLRDFRIEQLLAADDRDYSGLDTDNDLFLVCSLLMRNVLNG